MTAEPATLRCPSCGAPASPEAGRCAYCQSRLATIGCPVCMGLLFDGAAFCPSCGAPRDRSADFKESPARCPACKSAMQWVRVGEVDLLECGACDGTWIEAETFSRLCARREEMAMLAEGARRVDDAPNKSAPRPAPAPVRYRPCPRCGKMMNRENFGRLSGTIVDTCRGHGTFLDRGELHQVVRFILDGGFDRTRRAEIERLREEQNRLRILELHLSRSRGQD